MHEDERQRRRLQLAQHLADLVLGRPRRGILEGAEELLENVGLGEPLLEGENGVMQRLFQPGGAHGDLAEFAEDARHGAEAADRELRRQHVLEQRDHFAPNGRRPLPLEDVEQRIDRRGTNVATVLLLQFVLQEAQLGLVEEERGGVEVGGRHGTARILLDLLADPADGSCPWSAPPPPDCRNSTPSLRASTKV